MTEATSRRRAEGSPQARRAHATAVDRLEHAGRRRVQAERDLAEAEQRQASVATSDASEAELEKVTRRIRDLRDLLSALTTRVIPEAENAVQQAHALLEDSVRSERYQQAKELRQAAQAKLQKEYPEIVSRYQALCVAVETADAAVVAVNRDLPQGCEELLTVEELARDHQSSPGGVISEEVRDIWHFADGRRVEDQSRVKGGKYHFGDSRLVRRKPETCVAIPKRVVVTAPKTPGARGARLAKTALPPLRPPAPEKLEVVTTYHEVEVAVEPAAE